MSKRLEASSVPRVAAVGVGYWGRNVARNLGELGALAAVVDDDRVAATAIAEAGGARVDTFESVLGAVDIDAVAIAAPASMHFELAREALNSGKHTFVEKPLALQVSHAEELTELASQKSLVLMVGHLMRYHPAYIELQRLVTTGRLGRIQYIYSNRLNFGKIRVEEDALWSFAPHDI